MAESEPLIIKPKRKKSTQHKRKIAKGMEEYWRTRGRPQRLGRLREMLDAIVSAMKTPTPEETAATARRVRKEWRNRWSGRLRRQAGKITEY